MDGRVRQQSFRHLVGALARGGHTVGLEIDLEAVGRPQGLEFEAQSLEACFVVSASGSSTPCLSRTVTVAV